MLTDPYMYWLALMRVPELNGKQVLELMNSWGDLDSVFNASQQALEQGGLSPSTIHSLKAVDWCEVEADYKWLYKANVSLVTITDCHYPNLLLNLHSPPSALLVRGNANALNQFQLAVVGSRNASPNGIDNAYQFAVSLAKSGLAITSGLALGIDGAAHKGALSVPAITLAVMACGLDQVYPRRHQRLAEQIIEQDGALISSFPRGAQPKRLHFPIRNRLISGLSLGVLVVEATVRSGSLITASCAIRQNREVFAIPGCIHNPTSRGCHALIRQGAKLVETTQDVIEEIESLRGWQQQNLVLAPEESASEMKAFSKEQKRVMSCMSEAPVSVDWLAHCSGYTYQHITEVLFELECQGAVVRGAGGYYKRWSAMS